LNEAVDGGTPSDFVDVAVDSEIVAEVGVDPDVVEFIG
jgi:hypothetical protein